MFRVTIELFLYTIIGGLLGLVGGFVFIYIKPWSRILARFSTPFAAGVLLTVTFLGLLPEAVHAGGETAYYTMLAAFLGAYLFEHLLFGIHHHEHHGHDEHQGSVPLVIVGDTIHNFIDGVAIAASYLTSPGLGLVTAFSSFLHEVPHEIGDFGILLAAGWKKRQILLVNIFSALATILGAYLLTVLPVGEFWVGQALAVAAGIFLYLGASDFLPQVEMSGKRHVYDLLSLLLGVLVMAGTLLAIPHEHDGDDHDTDRIEDTEYRVDMNSLM